MSKIWKQLKERYLLWRARKDLQALKKECNKNLRAVLK